MDHLIHLSQQAETHPDWEVRRDLRRLQAAVEAAPLYARMPPGDTAIRRLLALAEHPDDISSWGSPNRQALSHELGWYEDKTKQEACG